jgi:pimeloyl-ACP methyl ester carboxylesterase
VQPETRYARSKDGDVAYQVVGNGPLDLVFLPLWATNVEVMWEEPSFAHFLRRLGTFSRLLCFDKRGTGVSDPVPLAALPSLEQWMDDVRIVMDAAHSKRAALLGQGDGGQMAMLFAATYPERTSALILSRPLGRASVSTRERRLEEGRYLPACAYSVTPCMLAYDDGSPAVKRACGSRECLLSPRPARAVAAAVRPAVVGTTWT